MGVSKSKAAENRHAIVETATRLFRRHGIEAVGVYDLMREAGFTHGGFYNHFASKDALVAEAMSKAMADTCSGLDDVRVASGRQGGGLVSQAFEAYLDRACGDASGEGCAVATFVGEAKHMGHEARQVYATGVVDTIARLSMLLEPKALSERTTRDRAISVLCEFVGTLALARAVVEIDRVLADEIVASGRREILARVDGEPA